MLAFLVVVAVLAGTVLRPYLHELVRLLQADPLGGLYYCLCFVGAVLLGVPSTVFEIGAGVIFEPFVNAFLIATAAKNAACWIAFALGRALGRHWADEAIFKAKPVVVRAFLRTLERDRIKVVFLWTASYTPIWTKVRRDSFFSRACCALLHMIVHSRSKETRAAKNYRIMVSRVWAARSGSLLLPRFSWGCRIAPYSRSLASPTKQSLLANPASPGGGSGDNGNATSTAENSTASGQTPGGLRAAEVAGLVVGIAALVVCVVLISSLTRKYMAEIVAEQEAAEARGGQQRSR